MKKMYLLIGIISGICFLSWNGNLTWADEAGAGVAFSQMPSRQNGATDRKLPSKSKPTKSKYWSGKQHKQAGQDLYPAQGEQTGRIRPVSDVVPRPDGGRPQILSAGAESLSSVIEEIEDDSRESSSIKSGISKFFGAGGKSKNTHSSARPSGTRENGKRIRVSVDPGMQLLQENNQAPSSVPASNVPAASVPMIRETTAGSAGQEAPVLVKEDERDLKRRVSVPQSPSSPMQPLPVQPQAESVPDTAAAQAAKAPESGSFVVTNSSPVIDIKTSGPKRIVVGQESVFQIHVRNVGTVGAEKMVISTEIPAWVEIGNIAPSRGNSSLSPERKSNDAVVCQWRLDLLAPGKDEILTMRLIPRQRNNFELTSQYDFEQSAMKAGIEVQEPLIELAIDGRDQIEWGAEDKYRLRVRNTGNGDATNLRLTVTTGDNQQVTHPLGLLRAGEERTMELAVKTHVEDKVNIRIDAVGDYGLSASTSKSITVLRGKIDVYAEVPELQFVNNSVECLVRVANTGTAPLQNVKVAVALPSEMKMLSCTGEGQLESDKGQVVWIIPNVSVGQEIVYQMTCQMILPGVGRLNVAASDATGQSAVSDAAIQIEAIASLRVDIKSPGGPIPVGSPVVYEVTVRNDGTRAARDVSAVLFLSKALCPTDVEHGAGVVSPIDGKVVFNRIGILGPGQSTSYKVTAQVAAPGNHKVQAVLESGSESIQLASEAMTYCYEKRTVARRERDYKPENKANVPMTAQAPVPAPTQNALQTAPLQTNNEVTQNPQSVVNSPSSVTSPFPTPQRVALQTNPRPRPQLDTRPQNGPLPVSTGGMPAPANTVPDRAKSGETKTAQPINQSLLLTPFPQRSAPSANVNINANANANNVPADNSPQTHSPQGNSLQGNSPLDNSSLSPSALGNSPLTPSALPQLPALPESNKGRTQPDIKTPEPALQPVADRDLVRF